MMRKKHLSRFQWLGKRIRNRHFPSFASQLFPRFTSSKTSKKLTNFPLPLHTPTFLPLSSSSIGHSRSTDHFWAPALLFFVSSFFVHFALQKNLSNSNIISPTPSHQDEHFYFLKFYFLGQILFRVPFLLRKSAFT